MSDDLFAKRPLGSLGWAHCKQVLPRSQIDAIKSQLSEWMGCRDNSISSWIRGGIDQQAKSLFRDNGSFQLNLQEFLGETTSIYELALSKQIHNILADQIGWPQSSLSPIHNIRAKFPKRYGVYGFTTVPWHQDYGATDPTQDDVNLVTAWIPLTNADAHHGGLEIIPRSTQLGWLPHIRGERGPEVDESALQNSLQCRPDLIPFQIRAMPGDVILFDQYTLHRSLVNRSRHVRWSVDMRYMRCGSSSGRPGLWSRNPIVAEPVNAEVMSLANQRLLKINDPAFRVKKRVDFCIDR